MIIIIVLLVIILIILLRYECFTIDSEPLNNLVTQINNNSLTIKNITGDNLTAKNSLKSEKSIEAKDGIIKNDLAVNNNLSVKNNISSNNISSNNAKITDTLTTNRINFKNMTIFNNVNIDIVKVQIKIRDNPNSRTSGFTDEFMTFNGFAIKDNQKLTFINVFGYINNDRTGACKPTVAYDKYNNLSIGLQYHNDSNYRVVTLDAIVGVYYSHNDVNVVRQYRHGGHKGNAKYLSRDSDQCEVFPSSGCLCQWTCALIR